MIQDGPKLEERGEFTSQRYYIHYGYRQYMYKYTEVYSKLYAE